MTGLGFNPRVGHLGTWDFPGGGHRDMVYIRNYNENLGTPLQISLWWLECVDDELSALAVTTLSLSTKLHIINYQ